MTDDAFVRHVQARLQAAGHYAGRIDGAAGPMTMAALDKALPAPPIITAPPPAVVTVPVDDIPDSGDRKLVGVHPVLADLIRAASLRSDTPFTVSEGLRTRERQAQLVKAGASKTMRSRHLTGHAVDLWPLGPDLKPLPSDAAYPRGSVNAKRADATLRAGLRAVMETVRAVAKERGVAIELGMDWGWDFPHAQLSRAAYPA